MLVGAIPVVTELYISIGTEKHISPCVCVHVIGVWTTVCLAERSTKDCLLPFRFQVSCFLNW